MAIPLQLDLDLGGQDRDQVAENLRKKANHDFVAIYDLLAHEKMTKRCVMSAQGKLPSEKKPVFSKIPRSPSASKRLCLINKRIKRESPEELFTPAIHKSSDQLYGSKQRLLNSSTGEEEHHKLGRPFE